MSSFPMILIVEDDSDVAYCTSRGVRNFLPHCEINHALNGRAAVQYLLLFAAPTLLITDLEMPEMDGVSLVEWIRSHPEFRFPVIVYTGSINPNHKARCLHLGVDGFFPKDGQLLDLCAKVGDLLAKEHNPLVAT